METIKVTRTVYPDNRPATFNEWSRFIFSQCKLKVKTKKTGWEGNIFIPKKTENGNNFCKQSN
jgi:hypothetical protein